VEFVFNKGSGKTIACHQKTSQKFQKVVDLISLSGMGLCGEEQFQGPIFERRKIIGWEGREL
jgi:hypothetical protein